MFKLTSLVRALTRAFGPLYLQGDQSVANQAGASFRADMNLELQALVTNSSGASGPATTYAYQWWVDTANGLLKQRNAANSAWIVRANTAEAFLISRSSDTVIGVSDYGKTFICTSTYTQTFTAAATLGDGFWCEFRNDGTGIITFDPNGSETIDGVTTLALLPGESCIVNCNNSAFKTVGRAPQLPPGAVTDFAGASIPVGWLACDGSAISRTTFAGLFAVLSTTWGVGDGSTTFNLPDFRGRATIGDGTGSGLTARTLAGTGGEETHLLTVPEMPNHQHTTSIQKANGGGGGDFSTGLAGAATAYPSTFVGGGGAHNNMQPFSVVKKIIKY